MYEAPRPRGQGQFYSEPEGRNVMVTYMFDKDKVRAVFVIERADVPDLIKLLQDSYGL